MHDNDIILSLWKDEDEHQILDLVRMEYGDIDTSHPDYFDWEYCRNPAGRAAICCAKASDGTLAAVYVAIPVPVIFKGTPMTASLSLNTLTHPDFRGRGLFPKCATMVYETLKQSGNAFTYGFPNPQSYAGFTRKLAFADIGRARLLIHPHDLSALLSSRFPAARWIGIGGLDRLLVRGLLRRPKQKMTVKAKSTFDGLPLEKLQENAELSVDSKIEWLTWRYIDIPRRRYFLVTAENRTGPVGLAIYRISYWDNVKVGTINDVLLAPDSGIDVVESLIYCVLGECETNGCAATLALVSPGSTKLQLLKRSGFWIVPSRFEPQPFPVILRGHTVDTSDISISDMEVSLGAYDVF